MTEAQEPAEIFKRATVATARTLSGEPEVEVMFSADPPGVQKRRIRLPAPGRELPVKERMLIRGAADAASLRLRFHNAKTFRHNRPPGEVAAQIYEALEQARCEALGARAMEGVGKNLTATLEERCRRIGFHEAKDRMEVPIHEALRCLAHEVLSGQPLPPAAKQAANLWREFVEKRVGLHLGALPVLLSDQQKFAEEVRRLLKELKLDFPGVPEREEDESAAEKSVPDNLESGEGEQEGEGAGENRRQKATADKAQEGQEAQAGEEGERRDDPSMGEEAGDKEAMPDQPGEVPMGMGAGLLTTYNAYTTQFDEIIGAEDLCPGEELIRLRLQLDNQLRHYQGVVARLANRLQRRLLAQQARGWDFDREEGLIDAARLSRVVIDPSAPLSFKVERDTEFRDTVVSLLIDNSGSMRGRPITLAAITADILARTLERCAVKVEILGFTTSAWKGGRAREAWLKAGKPPHPGRLNDLRHVVYKGADAPWRRARKNLGLMLREGLLKENIDGEALDWAYQRLLRRGEERRILMVVSDGAPVDDSTLSVNPGTYLEDHLRQVIARIEDEGAIELTAIGIGHDVRRYYRRAVTLTDAEQLGGTVMGQLAELFEVGD
ncbi:MAG TPA: cobaltochelatase subunit CobT [Alphaproteobacteria bacterium]|nr:cobaltochelatase subunit CobT [Alphaproteobacteria bacterium]